MRKRRRKRDQLDCYMDASADVCEESRHAFDVYISMMTTFLQAFLAT
jgi:hypothetical protein